MSWHIVCVDHTGRVIRISIFTFSDLKKKIQLAATGEDTDDDKEADDHEVSDRLIIFRTSVKKTTMVQECELVHAGNMIVESSVAVSFGGRLLRLDKGRDLSCIPLHAVDGCLGI